MFKIKKKEKELIDLSAFAPLAFGIPLLLLLIVMVFLQTFTEKIVKIEEKTWMRAKYVDQYKTVRKSEWYRYEYYEDDLVHTECLETSGNQNTEPYWKSYILGNKEQFSDDKHEEYHLILTNEEGKKEQLNVSFSDWQKLSVGMQARLNVPHLGESQLIEIIEQ